LHPGQSKSPSAFFFSFEREITITIVCQILSVGAVSDRWLRPGGLGNDLYSPST
jgi:hypothetical protein